MANAAVVLFSASPFLSRTAAAGDVTYNLSYAAEYSDNVRQTPTNHQEELAHALSAGMLFNETNRELDTHAQLSATYRDYQHNIFADSTTYGLNGTLVWKPLPEAFHWTVQDVYTQVGVNPAQADTPANRVNANVFSTGPDAFWRISSLQTLQVGGRYAESSFHATANTVGAGNTDNTSRTGNARWFYHSSPVTTFSLGYLVESVAFDDPGGSSGLDFRRSEASVGLASKFARNNLTLDLGQTRIKRENQQEVDGALERLSWVRELTSDSTFSLSASRALTDAAAEVLATAGTTAPAAGPATISTTDIFVAKELTALYSRRSGTNSFSLSAFRIERAFEITKQNDEDAKGADVAYTHTFSERVLGTASYRYVKTQFPALVREDQDRLAALGLQYKFTRTVSSGFAVSQLNHSSTLPGTDYVDNRAVLSVSYNSLPYRW